MIVENEDYHRMNDGIETCEDLCDCGSCIRLHSHTFNKGKPQQRQRYYVDCTSCGKTSDWHDTIDEAISEFDSLRIES